jgi:hypothetical protein
MSALSMPTLDSPTMLGFARSSNLVTAPFRSSVFTPMPVRPDCQGIENLFPGSKAGSLANGAAYWSKLGRFVVSSGSTHSLAVSAVNSRPFVITMMSQPVGSPACSCGWSLPKNDALSWITSW